MLMCDYPKVNRGNMTGEQFLRLKVDMFNTRESVCKELSKIRDGSRALNCRKPCVN
jgi:hypothetical protein